MAGGLVVDLVSLTLKPSVHCPVNNSAHFLQRLAVNRLLSFFTVIQSIQVFHSTISKNTETEKVREKAGFTNQILTAGSSSVSAIIGHAQYCYDTQPHKWLFFEVSSRSVDRSNL